MEKTEKKPGRRRRVVIAVAAVIVVAIVVSVAVWPGEREPEYQGKKLSEWLLYADDLTVRFPDEEFERVAGPRAKEAATAVRGMTNAAVVLLNWFKYRPSALRTKACLLAQKLPKKVRQNEKVRNLIMGEGLLRASVVANGFYILGSAAAPAVPELTSIMQQSNDPMKRRQATMILMSVGDAGMAPLLKAMTDQKNPNRLLILSLQRAFYRFRAGPSSAIPALVQCLADKDPQVAMAACEHLGNFGLEQPEVVVPALTNALAVSNAPMQVQLMRAISKFGERGRAAVPLLLRLYDSTNSVVSAQAGNTLRFVDSEALSMHKMEGRHD